MKEYDTMITIKEIQKIIKDFENSELTELELSIEDVKIKLSKNKHEVNPVLEPVKVTTLEQKPVEVESKKSLGLEIKSPLVGTFYRSESPTAKPFVEVGQVVNKGDVLCIIEAMKIMNEITAPASGKVLSIGLKDKDVVSFDQVLMTLEENNEA